MFRCMIVDDESPAREELRFLLSVYEDIEVVAQASYGTEAIQKCKEYKPNLVFLDIQMPLMSGIEVANALHTSPWLPIIIFTTAYDDFALQAFETNAVDYLLKPISKERLQKALDKSRELLTSLENAKEERSLKHVEENKVRADLSNASKSIKKICLYKNGSLIPVAFGTILYAVVENNNTRIVTDKDIFDYPYPLSHLEEKLADPIFFRCHRNYIINLDYMEKIETWFNGTYRVHLKACEEKVPVSRNKVKDFKRIMAIV